MTPLFDLAIWVGSCWVLGNDSSFKFGVPSSPGRKSFTPKAFHIVAQGCREAAHPGF